jgi:hypothetical protein
VCWRMKRKSSERVTAQMMTIAVAPQSNYATCSLASGLLRLRGRQLVDGLREVEDLLRDRQ